MFKRLPLGIYGANCYIITDDNSKSTAVIDPGGDFKELKRYIDSNNLKIEYIILTHGHGDHVGAVPELKSYTSAPICINSGDAHMISSNDRRNFMSTGILGIGLNVDKILDDNEILMLGETKLQIIHTPGHSKGSICIKYDNDLFSGDTLFAASIGRTDIEGGSFDEIIENIKTKLLTLPEETNVHPGHGPSTTIGLEKKRNPFLV